MPGNIRLACSWIRHGFFETLVLYETDLWNHIDGRLREAGIPSLGTVFALRVVARHACACRVQELRFDLGITVGTPSRLVDRLERDGLATRRAYPGDRRSSLVELTADGRGRLERGVALAGDVLAEHRGDDTDVAAVAAVLGRLDERLRPRAAAVAS